MCAGVRVCGCALGVGTGASAGGACQPHRPDVALVVLPGRRHRHAVRVPVHREYKAVAVPVERGDRHVRRWRCGLALLQRHSHSAVSGGVAKRRRGWRDGLQGSGSEASNQTRRGHHTKSPPTPNNTITHSHSTVTRHAALDRCRCYSATRRINTYSHRRGKIFRSKEGKSKKKRKDLRRRGRYNIYLVRGRLDIGSLQFEM